MTTTYEQTKTADADTVGGKIAAYGVSYAITSIFNAILMIFKETYPAVQEGMVAITGHHWVKHGLLDVIVFVALGAYLSRGEGLRMTGNKLASTIVGGTVIGGLIVVGIFFGQQLRPTPTSIEQFPKTKSIKEMTHHEHRPPGAGLEHFDRSFLSELCCQLFVIILSFEKTIQQR